MNRYFALSCALHLALGLLVLVIMAPGKKVPSATYTIDFIGSGKVVAMQQAAAPAAAEKPEIKTETPPEPKPAEVKKPDPKAYESKTEISAKKQPQKAKPKPEPLAAPSILDEDTPADKTAETESGSGGEGEFAGGNVQTDFATFPYPWYIAQVRNSLWSEWEKRRPTGVSLSAIITFAIARDGKIKDLKLEKSSGNDSYDFAAKSAVINAGPFEPLPMLYEKDELTVTLELKPEK